MIPKILPFVKNRKVRRTRLFLIYNSELFIFLGGMKKFINFKLW